jgi:hypothetical protein
MILGSKYEVLQTIGGAAIIVHRARLMPAGRSVLVHKLGRGSQAFEAMKLALRYVIQHPPNAGGALLDIVEEADSTYIVTEDRAECLSLMDWLPWTLAGASVSGDEPAESSPADLKSGEFTGFFNRDQASPPHAASSGSGASLRTGPAPGVTESFPIASFRQPQADERRVLRPTRLDTSLHEFDAKSIGPQDRPPGEPGEFTRLFHNAAGESGERSAAPSSSPAVSANPGEFTRMFGNIRESEKTTDEPEANVRAPKREYPIERREPQRPQTRSDKGDPGEFTRILHRPGLSEPSSTASNSADTPKSAEPGEFTRLFRNPDPESVRGLPGQSSPPLGSQNAGEFTRVLRPQSNSGDVSDSSAHSFQMPREDTVEGRETREGPVAPQRPPAGGPGEFTRIVRGPAMSEASTSTAGSGEDTRTAAAPPETPKLQNPAFTVPAAVPRPAGVTVPQPPKFTAPAPVASAPVLPSTGAIPTPSRRLSPFLILFGVLILIAIALILIFALRR